MPLRKVFRFARPHAGWAIGSILFAISVVAVAMVPPMLARRIVDDVFVLSVGDGDFQSRTALLVILLAVMVSANVLRALLILFRNLMVEIYSQRVSRDFKQRLYDHIQSQSFDFFHNTRTGELMARMTNDVEMVRGMLAQGLMHGATGVFFIAASAVILAVLNWQLALLSALAAPALFYATFRLRRVQEPAIQDVRAQYSKLNTEVQENITGIRVVKSFLRYGHELQKFRKQNTELTRKRNLSLKIWATYLPWIEFLSGIASAVVLLGGGLMVIRGSITLGTWVQFNGYLWMLVQPMRTLGELANQVAMASASSDRIFEILDREPNIRNPLNPKKPAKIRGDVELRNVSWGLEGRPIIRDINLKAPAGSTVAIMGPMGAGKSSLVHLIPRFYDPDAGQVLIDGVDVREMDLATLRDNIGLVSQETFLFSETLYNNLTYGREGAPPELVEKVAIQTQADEFVQPLADGYETVVGEKGVGLSGGQKQRASIARALMKQAPILILDDSTSSVDMETEAKIQDALRNLDHRATTFIIAHRISSVIHADEIVVLDHGRIVERGSHAQLLSRGGLYAEYFAVQYADLAAGAGRA